MSEAAEDRRLDRLLDYTKFHIGIYLSAGGGMVTLLAAAANAKDSTVLRNFVESPVAMIWSAGFMMLAGLAGGVIASCCTQCSSFETLWNKRQGPHTLQILPGRYWALIEHLAFWAGCALAAYSVLASQGMRAWIGS